MKTLYLPLLLVMTLAAPQARAAGAARLRDVPATVAAAPGATAPEALRLAAQRGDADAQNRLGEAYEIGDDVPKDLDMAVAWFQKAAAQGHIEAQFNLGTLYHNGEGVTADATAAQRWWRRAAEHGHAGAQYSLALMYENGEGVAPDLAQAFDWYLQAARQGDAAAQFSAGAMLAQGRGTAADRRAAAEWFRRSAEQGNLSAQVRLAELLDTDDGAWQDYPQAAHWYGKAAEQGDAAAQNNLGVLYRLGRGVVRSRVIAWALYDLAAGGEPAAVGASASDNRAALAREMSAHELEAASALASDLARAGAWATALQRAERASASDAPAAGW